MRVIETCRAALEAYWLSEGYDPSEPDEAAIQAVLLALRDAVPDPNAPIAATINAVLNERPDGR